MYTTELYKSVTVNERSSEESNGWENVALQENPEVGDVGEVRSGTDGVEFEEDWSQKWMLIENSL